MNEDDADRMASQPVDSLPGDESALDDAIAAAEAALAIAGQELAPLLLPGLVDAAVARAKAEIAEAARRAAPHTALLVLAEELEATASCSSSSEAPPPEKPKG